MKLSLVANGLGLGVAIGLAACAVATEQGTGSEEPAYTQDQVSNDPVLKALQERAANVEEYEINVDDIAVPIPSASTGASVNGFSTRGLDWFKNPAVSYPNNKSWDQGSDTGKKCQWASIFRFNAIFSDAPGEAKAMRELVMPSGQRARWSGSFWSWIDDYASTDSVGTPTSSYAWSSGLWKWIGASGKGGICRIPTRTMVIGMMTACKAQAEANEGDPKNCRMPKYTPPAPDAGPGDAGTDATEGEAGSDAGASDAGASDAAED